MMAQAEKTLVKSLDISPEDPLTAVFDGKTFIREWDNNYYRLNITVKLPHSSPIILEKLIKAGRYDVSVENIDNENYISMPKIKKKVSIQGKELEEIFEIEIYSPKGATLRIDESVAMQTD